MLDQELIREEFKIQIREDRLSLGSIERETGVSRSTLSRFTRGVGNMDTDNLLKIAAFLRIENLSDGIECDGRTLENVKAAIRRDRNLTGENKIRLWRLFCAMYRALTSG